MSTPLPNDTFAWRTTEPADQPRYIIALEPGSRHALAESLPLAAALAAWEFIQGLLRR